MLTMMMKIKVLVNGLLKMRLKANYRGREHWKQQIKKLDNQNLSRTSIILSTQSLDT